MPTNVNTGSQNLSPLGNFIAKIIGTPYQGTHTRGNWESDNAIDLAAPVGTPVYAVTTGKIGTQIGALNSSDPHLEGLRLHLQTPTGFEAYYAHLSKILVHAGDTVQKGQLLGYTGSANGVAHLHFATNEGNPMVFTKPGKVPTFPATGGNPGGIPPAQMAGCGTVIAMCFGIWLTLSGGLFCLIHFL